MGDIQKTYRHKELRTQGHEDIWKFNPVLTEHGPFGAAAKKEGEEKATTRKGKVNETLTREYLIFYKLDFHNQEKMRK